MSNPPRTGVSSPETAKKAAPRPSVTDPDARTSASVKAPKGGGSIHAQGDVYTKLTPAEKVRRLADYFTLIKGPKYKFLYGTDAYIRMMKNRRIIPPDAGCRTDFSVYLPTSEKMPISRNAQGEWLCKKSIDSAITFRERKYQNQENDLRVFIEGAEVTPYVDGSISWTIESTGGVNTCRFMLNNTQDAFIITPTNVCAGPYNLGGWRMPYLRRGKSRQLHVYKGIGRSTWRVDEVAKWQIYKRKYEAVNPDKEKKQIDSFTGMWLYPLNPFSCIFNKHDAVRVFVKLPHVTDQRKPGTTAWYDLWMPAFTGFIDKYSWSDSPVEGKRTVSITCYDYRGLMERMRVRVYSLGVTDSGGTNKGNTAGQTSGQRGPAQNNAEKNTPSHQNKAYLKRAITIGNIFENKIRKAFTSAKYIYVNSTNPYEYGAEGFFLETTFIDLHTLWFKKEFDSAKGGRGCGVGTRPADIRRGHLTKKESIDSKCTFAIVAGVDSTVSTIAADITTSIGYLLKKIALIYDLIGDGYAVAADVTKVAVAVGNSPGKSRRVVSLKLINVVTAKAKSLETTALKAARHIESGKVGQEFSYRITNFKELYKQDAVIYAAAATYFYGSTKISAASSINTQSNDERSLQKQGWVAWLGGATGSGVLKLSEKEYDELVATHLSGTVDKYKRRLIEHDQDVYDIMNNYGTGFMSRVYDTAPLKVTSASDSNKRIRQLEKEKAQLKKDQKKAEDKKDKKSQERIKKEIIDIDRQISALKNRVVSSDFGTRWTDILGWKRIYIGDETKEYADSIVGTNFKAEDLQNKTIGDNAANLMLKYIDPKIKEWISSYRKLSTNARILATKILKQTNDILSTKSRTTAPSGTYKSYVKVIAEKNHSSVHIGDALRWINWKRDELSNKVRGGTSSTALKNTQRFIESIRQQTAAGQAALTRSKSVADALLKFGHFETRHAGIFADLVTAVGLQPHPLMGKSLDQSIEYLCCEQQRIFPGVKMSVSTYKDGGGIYIGRGKSSDSDTKSKRRKTGEPHGYGKTVLDAWNRTVLFGVVGRPLTFPEVTLAGQGTLSDFRSAFSPYNVFYHMLKPADGTGASTIIQLNTAKTTINSLNVSYETRKKMLDDICSVLDYQYWVSGWGDLIFEMPHYNSLPRDFGKIVEQSYTLKRDWSRATISEEAQDIPTAWVINGQHVDKTNSPTEGNKLTSNFFKTVVIMAPILARRLGVRVENINLKIPGLGGAGDSFKDKKGRQVSSTTHEQAQDQLKIYGYFHIQRQLGRAHTLQIDMPFRPYIVPNRPIWFVPRQRIGLVRSVTHTMNPPMGTCSTETNLSYTRWLFRDGTFRFAAGGPRQPVSYMSFFAGVPPRKSPKEGTLNENKNATQRSDTGAACSSELTTVARQASAFSTAVANQWGVAYSSPIRISRPSLAAVSTVDLTTSGFRASSQSSPDGPTDVMFTQASNVSGDPLKYMNPIWKDIGGEYKYKTKYESFGYLRNWRRSGANVYTDPRVSGDAKERRKGSGGWDTVHYGWDLQAGLGAPAKTPIDVLYASISLRVGNWKSAGGKTLFAKIGRGNTSKSILYQFRVGSLLKIVNGYIKIWAEPYVIWRSLGGVESGIDLKRGVSTGLKLSIQGYTSVPKLQHHGGRLFVQLDYLHLSNIERFPTGKKNGAGKDVMVPLGGKGLQKWDGRTPLVTAGQKICYAGATGATGAHLHLNMKVKNSAEGGGASEDQLRVTIAANTAFIDAQLRARAAFYTYKGTDPRDDLKKVTKASSYWQGYWRRRALKKKKGAVTVNDVLSYYKSRKTYREFVPEKMGTGEWIYVYAALFYTYDQILFTGRARSKHWQGRAQRYTNFRHLLAQSAGSSKFQTKYRSICQHTASVAMTRLQAELKRCENKYPPYPYRLVGGGAVLLTGQPLRRVQTLLAKCRKNVQNQINAIGNGVAILRRAPINSYAFKHVNQIVAKSAKGAAAIRNRELNELREKEDQRKVNSLGRSITGSFI